MRYTKRQYIGMFIVGAVAIYPMCRILFGIPALLSAIISVASEIFFLLSLFFEKRSADKFDEIKANIKNGGQATSLDEETWNKKYAEFKENDGFHTVSATSMKADLFRRYTRPSGYIFVLLGIATAVAAIYFLHGSDGGDIVVSLIGLGFVIYGSFGIYPKNVRKFIRSCGDELPEINDAYMNGKTVTFKKTIAHEYINSGINIGERYVIIFNVRSVELIERSKIVRVVNNLTQTKLYGDGLYTGTAYSSYAEIYTDDGVKHSVQLNDLQAALVCEYLQHGEISYERSTANAKKEFNV